MGELDEKESRPTPHEADASQEERQRLDTDLNDASSVAQSSAVDLATPTPFSPGSERFNFARTASDISGDVVFPIRSVVSVDPPQAAEELYRLSRRNTVASSTSNDQATASRPSRQRFREDGPMSSIQADAARYGADPIDFEIATSEKDLEGSELLDHVSARASAFDETASQMSEGQTPGELPHMATRFNYVQTEDGHAVITGRDGILQRCEDEPIHTPGAVQGFGTLLAMHEETDGSFTIRYVSENSERLLGYSPRKLFRLSNFLAVLTEEQQDNLLDHIDFIRDEDADAANGPEVFGLSIRHPKLQKTFKLWCAIHINTAHPDLVICEFELDNDHIFPLRPSDENIAEPPVDTLNSNPTREELEESTEMLSKPLRILRSARKRRGEQGAMQVFDIMSQVQEQLSAAQSMDAFLKILVGIVKELTGFHRVMIYQFDSSFNGKVVTELVDTVQTKDLYKGLHFPASDIPSQARQLYKVNKVRLLYDRDQETARVVCRTKEDLEVPLDMTHAYLRAMSPIHLKYLGHMQVRSSMSISIDAFSELWGLVACHSYGNFGMRVSFPVRKMCRLIGETASRNIERLSYASRLQARKLINTSPTDKNPSGYIVASSDDLLKLFDADFGLLSIKDETKILGSMQHGQEALALLEYLRLRRLTSVTASQDVKADFRDLHYEPGFQQISGLLYVPLSVGGNDFIVFFRKGQVEEIKWAGNPYEKMIRDGTASYLEPRSSFKTWHEMVLGKCREWTNEQIETAAVLCLIYGKFIEIWRQKEQALQNSKLTKILLANSAHEVRTPLNAIINYLEIAMEGALDDDTRDNLSKSHSASKSLIYVINDLLDLTKAEEGQHLIKDDVFELASCIKEATEPFEVEAQRKGIKYEVVTPQELPTHVYGDGRRVRQAISNLTANAVSNTHSGFVRIEVIVTSITQTNAIIEFMVIDSGIGMDAAQVESLFRDLEQVGAADPESPDIHEKPDGFITLGLGLAVVGRIVHNMQGQLRVKSEPGTGSRFVIQLPFQLPDKNVETPKSASSSTLPTQTSSFPTQMDVEPSSSVPTSAGEVTLVSRSSRELSRVNAREGSIGSGSRRSGSRGSQDSKRSDTDRLIDAIRTPLSIRDGGEPEHFSPRRHSKGDIKTDATGSTQQRRSFEGGGVSEPVNLSKMTHLVEEYQGISKPDSVDKIPKLVEIQHSPASQRLRAESVTTSELHGGEATTLRVLIAEDDPINMRVLKKRLERAGHAVQVAVNGEECAAIYKNQSSSIDIILMDMQMPIVDGLTSTQMIRELELSSQHTGYSSIAKDNGRTPIFAVSASLVEKEKEKYTTAGFDGWILKPVNFKRLEELMSGTHQEPVRCNCLYTPGNWEHGGWFVSRSDITGPVGDAAT